MPILRRSCEACAKSKHSCDLLTPRCSRCQKRRVECKYVNEPGPLTLPSKPTPSPPAGPLASQRFSSLDPFESYPRTRLPRPHVQRLMHSFLNKIAFQYYPLDLDPTSNPFLVSWWPVALGDPALFHVSLQTACLDEEMLSQTGFRTSELLMADSVALLRRKLDDTPLALQDGTLNAVITLALIEHGKANTEISKMHISGVKRLVHLRGGINAIRQTSPLTARMVPWVSLLITGSPQFPAQSDDGIGCGISPIPEWQSTALSPDHQPLDPNLSLVVDPDILSIFLRLRRLFYATRNDPLQPTQLHDLACFVIHRMLLSPQPKESSAVELQVEGLLVEEPFYVAGESPASPLTECIRYGVVLYMFIAQGPTYFPHGMIFRRFTARYTEYLKQLVWSELDTLEVWFLALGLVAAEGTEEYEWFAERARELVSRLELQSWVDVFAMVRGVLWLETDKGEEVFQQHWEGVFGEGEGEVKGAETRGLTRSLVLIR